jgi:S1-C subfamily serine protease
MNGLRLGAAMAIVLASASYAWSASPDEQLGQALPSVKGAVGGAAPISVADGLSGIPGRAVAKAVSALTPDVGATRGAADTRVYQAASPAVVLVITEDGLGSGAIISTDGKIITNLHVVGDADEVGVVFKPKVEGAAISEADVRPAKVIRRDQVADLALLQVKDLPAGVAPLALGAASDVQVGEDVHAIGHPTGQTWTYTRGIVSQIRRDFSWQARGSAGEHKATLIQTQTPINPGNSGGPLIDDQLKIVGINTMVQEGEGLNYAVSADDVKTFLARTSDRLPARATQAAVTKKSCKSETLAVERSEKNDGVYHEVDGDCDGKADVIIFEPDDPREAVRMLYDGDGDGKIDSILYDDDRDGNIDGGLYDTDADGKPDVRGYFRNGENEPYRMERITD